jgi:coenzyme F420 hydrogenase subunit delta
MPSGNPVKTMTPSVIQKPCLILGCGNPLFGDDGFAAEVVGYLESRWALPGDVACLDVGTAVRDILFDIILSEEKPERVIIIDAMAIEGAPVGEIREIGLDEIQAEKICDYSLHQFPTTNLLQEIQQLTSMEVRVLVVNPAPIPPEVQPGLSAPVKAAVPKMARWIREILKDVGTL